MLNQYGNESAVTVSLVKALGKGASCEVCGLCGGEGGIDLV